MAQVVTRLFLTILLLLSPLSFLLSIPVFVVCVCGGLRFLRHKREGEHYDPAIALLGAIGLLMNALIIALRFAPQKTMLLGDCIDYGVFINVPTLLVVAHPIYTLAVFGVLIWSSRAPSSCAQRVGNRSL